MTFVKRKDPVSMRQAFDQACLENPRNEVIRRLGEDVVYGDERAKNTIIQALADMGITRGINLTHSYQQSRVAHAFYAGDGIVVKVIPTDYLDTPGTILRLPSITTREVFSGERSYTIKTYPWISQGVVTQDDIETMRADIARIGMRFLEGDDDPRNVHRLPDAKGTLVGIDSCMFDGHGDVTPQLQEAWRDYIERLFPIYRTHTIPRQSETTSFKFFSIHDPNSRLIEFNLRDGKAHVESNEPPSPSRLRAFYRAVMPRIGLHGYEKDPAEIFDPRLQ